MSREMSATGDVVVVVVVGNESVQDNSSRHTTV